MEHLKIKTYAVSLGCAKNRVDTEKMLGLMGSAYHPVQELQQADVVLVNTCAFIEQAVQESLQQILVLAQEVEKIQPKPILAVTGCLPARYGLEAESELPEVDLWLDLQQQADWVQLLMPKMGLNQGSKQQRPDRIWDQGQFLQQKSSIPRVLSTPSGYAYLKISEGCHRKCSFCLIPQIRGPMVSRPVQEILQEARFLLAQGVRELCLVAQDLTAYGRDLGSKDNLQDLIGQLSNLSSLTWLRLLYLYPSGLNKKLLQFLRSITPPFLPYFDIPLQHADSEILGQMGRPFRKDPQQTVDLIRSWFPEASLRTSLIVGFPGESESRFQKLLEFVRNMEFDHLGVFIFAPEQGVKAAELPNQIPEQEKIRRQKEVLDLQRRISRKKLAAYPGHELQVIIDAAHEEWPTLYTGRAWFQAPEADGITYVSGHDLRPGQLVQAEVVESKDYDLVALA